MRLATRIAATTVIGVVACLLSSYAIAFTLFFLIFGSDGSLFGGEGDYWVFFVALPIGCGLLGSALAWSWFEKHAHNRPRAS